VLGAVGEEVRREWQLDDRALGALQTAFTLLYAFVGVPFGRLADTRSRRFVLAVGCFAWSLLTALCGAARGFWELFLLRLGVGLGEASCAPAANSLIADLVPPERRARALSVFMLGLPLGLAASYVVSGWVAQQHGWRAAFLVAGVPGLLAALFALGIDEPPRAHAAAVAQPARADFARLLAIPSLGWIIASGALHNFNMYALSSFLAPLLMRYHGLPLAEAGLWSTLVYGIAGGAGLYLGGHLSDKWAARRPDARLLLCGWATLGSLPLVLLALQRPRGDAAGFALLMGLAVLLMYVYYGSIYAALQDVVPSRLRGSAVALYFFAMYVLGASLGPFLTGALSDRLARHAGAAQGLHDAFYVVPCLGLLLAATLFLAARTSRRA